MTIWTIGHSTRSLREFVEILHNYKIKLVIDIRHLPGSKKFPHFNKENLEKTLPENGISYIHLPGLGGLRKVNKNSLNTSWKNLSFRAYGDYMETPAFEDAALKLWEIASEKAFRSYVCRVTLVALSSLNGGGLPEVKKRSGDSHIH